MKRTESHLHLTNKIRRLISSHAELLDSDDYSETRTLTMKPNRVIEQKSKKVLDHNLRSKFVEKYDFDEHEYDRRQDSDFETSPQKKFQNYDAGLVLFFLSL